ncbi:MAG: solute-binding protein [Desulfobulbaceae bacterium]|nr:solute-binding protein [Desulfobulbaceae bacterium]
MRSIRVLALCCVFLVSTAIASLAEEVRIGSGAAATENILKPIKAPFEKATGLTLGIFGSGPKNAFVDLEKGAVDAAAVGVGLDEWMALLKKEGVTVADPTAYQGVVIGKDKVIVLTHKSNPVKTLSKEQLIAIFTGKTTNWKDVGGNDAPILIVWGKMIQGTNSQFVKKMLDGNEPIKDVMEVSTADDIKNAVETNPEAIGIGPVSMTGPSLSVPATPELSRAIFLYTKGAPTPTVQKLISFITGEGAQYVIK